MPVGDLNIWEIAIEEAKKKDSEEQKTQGDATVVFIGGKGVGKTTVISKFLNKDENPKPTIALEYSYGRQNKSTALSKDVCHIWELGGGTIFSELLAIPITSESIRHLIVVLMLDLSKSQELLFNLETLLAMLRYHVDEALSKDQNLKEDLMEAAWQRLGLEHLDKDQINPFPIPLVIIGGKYDIFQDFEPQHKKIICRTLRFVSHSNGASLQFFSNRNNLDNLGSRTKALLSNLVFGTTISHYISQDYNKPLIIPFGADSLQQIESINTSDVGSKNSSYAVWKNAYETHFPQVVSKTTLPDDPAKDPNFKEPAIDSLRAQKDEELERYRKEVARRRKYLEDKLL